jgi:integrase/recombinase XerD
VLTQGEVVQLLKAESNLKMRTALTTIYATGLRVSEVVALTIKDIDSARMVIHIRQAKGRKDRIVMLSEQLLTILRDYWKRERPPHWLFPGLDGSRPVTTRSVQRACRKAADVAGLDKNVTVHTRCGTALRRISWSAASIFASSRICSATGASLQPPGMLGLPSMSSGRSKARWKP